MSDAIKNPYKDVSGAKIHVNAYGNWRKYKETLDAADQDAVDAALEEEELESVDEFDDMMSDDDVDADVDEIDDMLETESYMD